MFIGGPTLGGGARNSSALANFPEAFAPPAIKTSPVARVPTACPALGEVMVPAELNVFEIGSKSSALARTLPPSSYPPAIRTRPSAGRLAEHTLRATSSDPVVVNEAVEALQTSALYRVVAGLFPSVIPPAMSTLPSFKLTATCPERATDIEAGAKICQWTEHTAPCWTSRCCFQNWCPQ